jgi:hypothetical protein
MNCLRFLMSMTLFLGLSAKSYGDTIVYDSKTEINFSGQRVSVWQAYDTITDLSRIVAAYSTDGLSWSSPTVISQTDSQCSLPSFAIDNTGNVAVAWLVSNVTTGEMSIYGAMYNSFTNSWTPHELIAFSGDTFSLKSNGLGEITLTFSTLELGSYVIKATNAVAGTAGWTVPITISL